MTAKLICALALAAAPLCASAPVLFFSDITSGPSHGGENGNGAYVTLYGNFFGASQGASTATAGGGAMVNCKVWGGTWLWYQKLACQLGPAAASGNLIVTVGGQSSNPLPFTVTAGNIYFVSTAGSDNNSGSFTSPWATLVNARNAMQPGDITYAMNGVTQSSDDGTGWDSALLLSGGGQGNWCSSGAPRAMVAYPGATVTIGNPSGGSPDFGLRTSDCQGNYIFAGIAFRGQAPAQPGSGANYRFVASDITCPYSQGGGGGACFGTSQASYIYFYGNHVYNAGSADASALFQGVYFSTDSNFIDMGWNLVENVHGCRGVQVHSSPLGSGGSDDPTGHDQYSISIHDNTIHDTQCDGIIVDTVSPSQGPVAIYNNVIYNAGIGPDNPEDSGGWNCINVPGATENGPNGSGTVEIFNNTLFGCGKFSSPPYSSDNSGIAENGDESSGAPAIYVNIRNNLIYSVTTSLYPSGVPYFVIWNPVTGGLCADTDVCPWLAGSNNLLYGAGPPVTNLSDIAGSVYANPLVASTSKPDLHISSGSPASQAGTAVGTGVFGIDNTGRDHDGLARPAVPAIGAYEIASTTVTPPTPVIVKSATAGQIEPFAAGSIVAAYGANLAAAVVEAALPLGTSLDGTSVTVTDAAGVTRPALLFYVSPAQVNWEIPDGTAPGAATATFVNVTGKIQTSPIQIATVSPGLFELNNSGLIAAWVLPVVSGAAQSQQPVYQVSQGAVLPLPVSLGAADEQVYLELYGTGIRNAKNVTASMGGVSVPVLYSGAAPGYAGEDQVNIGPLPQSLAGQGTVNIVLTADGQTANPVNVTIQ